MSTRWIDFQQLQEQVSIVDVLAHLGHRDTLREKKGGKELVGQCPFHEGHSNTAFSVDVERGMYYCHGGCGGGNLFDLVALAEGIEADNRRDAIRPAAEKIAAWFGIEHSRGTAQRTRGKSRRRSGPKAAPAGTVRPVLSKQPLAPVLIEKIQKNCDPDHEYLWKRGLTVETAREFGVAYCKKGTMRGRCVVPLHNPDGECVGFIGRATEEDTDPRYKLPKYFSRKDFVFNVHRAKEHAERGVVIVEGVFDAMRCHQAGFQNVIALLGSSLSDEQIAILSGITDRFTLLLDGDEAGRTATRECVRKLWDRKLFVRSVKLEDGADPDTLSPETLDELLQTDDSQQV